jgi:hypothetical protein
MTIDQTARSRRNRVIGWALGLVAAGLYAAFALRWT